ncbi:MAG: DUF494 family protein [candidate division KSB1 bacterium]|nr:DUF494 family protein [candidate division KSB1 bacterium]MDQ7065764.1 DUF494 family protein [candidate division KSB1 bacterium]
MNERVVEILVYIMNHLRSKKGNLNQLELLSRDLLDRGYTENEISSAFSWLMERLEAGYEEIIRQTAPASSFSFRVLHELEQMIILPEAYGYLLQMKALGLLDDFDVEQVIERAVMLGSSKVDMPAIKAIIASVLAQDLPFDDGFFSDEETPIIH